MIKKCLHFFTRALPSILFISACTCFKSQFQNIIKRLKLSKSLYANYLYLIVELVVKFRMKVALSKHYKCSGAWEVLINNKTKTFSQSFVKQKRERETGREREIEQKGGGERERGRYREYHLLI